MIVVDTNVIAYFVVSSEHTTNAENVLRKDSEWAVPKIWRSELRNVLLMYIRRNTLDLDGALEKMDEAVRRVAGREHEVDSARVLELAHSSGCTAYDCEFVYVVEKLNAPLVTSDKKLLAAFPSIAVSMTDFVGNS